MDAFERAIREQGSVFAERLDALVASVQDAALSPQAWLPTRGRPAVPILITGMGSSYHAAVAGAAAFRRRGWPAYAVDASELLHHDLGAVTPETILLAVSQSGESAEVVGLLEKLPFHERLVGITNDRASTLGRRAPVVLDLAVPPDGSVAVKTYGWSVAALVLLAAAAAAQGQENPSDSLEASQEALQRTVDCLRRDSEALWSAARAAAPLFETRRTPVFVGRGPALSTIGQAALTFEEVLARPALALGAGQFRHGPMELFAGEVVLIAVARGSTAELVRRLVADAEAAGCQVLLLQEGAETGWSPGARGGGYLGVPVLREELAPLYDVVFFQALVSTLARLEGKIPGQFRFAQHVTRRE